MLQLMGMFLWRCMVAHVVFSFVMGSLSSITLISFFMWSSYLIFDWSDISMVYENILLRLNSYFCFVMGCRVIDGYFGH